MFLALCRNQEEMGARDTSNDLTATYISVKEQKLIHLIASDS